MVLLAVTADTWIITGLGFGIVLLLLFFLVFILQGFGWVMQKATAPKAPKAPKEEKKDDIAAIAMALYLASKSGKRDENIITIPSQARETAWNEKAIGLNNQGF